MTLRLLQKINRNLMNKLQRNAGVRDAEKN